MVNCLKPLLSRDCHSWVELSSHFKFFFLQEHATYVSNGGETRSVLASLPTFDLVTIKSEAEHHQSERTVVVAIYPKDINIVKIISQFPVFIYVCEYIHRYMVIIFPIILFSFALFPLNKPFLTP